MSFKKNYIAQELINWYMGNKRDLPWRDDPDPYKIWLSEIILQQTRVAQGLPYFLKFVEKYPTIFMLAKASEDDVLRVWQGLGYYSRARNMHKCAKTIVNQYNGIIPAERKVLINLPGIGPYTSAAIASLAYNKKVAVVDGNVIRVITRLFGIKEDISLHKTIKQINEIAEELIPKSQPGIFNQAIMEFGSRHCTPKKPSCGSCALSASCYAKLNGIQQDVPFKAKKTTTRVRFFNYLLLNVDGKYLLRKRKTRDIWRGLFEFFLIETDSVSDFADLPLPHFLDRQKENWYLLGESKTYKHLLSHQTIFCKFYSISASQEFRSNPSELGEYLLFSEDEIYNLPKSILIDRYLGEKIN